MEDLSQSENLPLQIKILSWFGIIFGSMYLIYSVVNIILSFLDRTQENLGGNFLILIYGIPIVAVSVAFMHKQKWGWFGYTLFLGLIILLSALGTKDLYGYIIGGLSLIAFIWVLTPSVRKHYFPS